MGHGSQSNIHFEKFQIKMARSSLSPYVSELLSSASPSLTSLANATPSQAGFHIDFKAIQVDVVAATGGKEEGSMGWYKVACATLAPHLVNMHRAALGLVREEREAKLLPFLSWTSHSAFILESWQVWDGGGETVGLELLLLLSPVLERSLGDLLTSVSGLAKVPALLRDLLRREELERVLGGECLLFLRLLLGSPFSLNLRNLVWHGFAAPQEISLVFASALLLVFPCIGDILKEGELPIKKRELGSLLRIQHILDANPILPSSDSSSLLMLAKSSHLPPPLQQLLLQGLNHRDAGEHLPAGLLLLPLVEALLRIKYVSANNCPQRLITAEATELYTTFTEMLTERSKLEEEVGEGLLLLMTDLFILPSGPRARDRLSHGEIAVEEKEEKEHLDSLGFVLVAILVDLLSPSNTLPLIQSAFHPAAKLAKSLLGSLEALTKLEKVEAMAREEVLTFQPDADLPELCTSVESSEMKKVLAPFCGSCLYRPKQECEMLSLLERAGSKLVEALLRLEVNLEERRKAWMGRDMRSRARNTHVRLVAALPRIRNTLLLLTIFLFNQLSDKDDLGELSPSEFSAKIKNMKKILKAVENLSENVETKTNKWEDALKHCVSLDGLISKQAG